MAAMACGHKKTRILRCGFSDYWACGALAQSQTRVGRARLFAIALLRLFELFALVRALRIMGPTITCPTRPAQLFHRQSPTPVRQQ